MDAVGLDLATSIQQFLEKNSLQGGILQIGNENSVTICTTTEAVENRSDDCAAKLESALKEIYKQLTLPKLSWLDEGMDLALDTFYMELQLDKDKRLIKLEDLFNCCSNCNRLLIESKPGYGKTTFCIKLLYDWANDEPYTEQFKLAFLIPLKNLPEEGIEDGLAAILPGCGVDKNRLMDVIIKMGDRVLIVLDGFDELSPSHKQSVLRVVYRQRFCNATVILTVRTGEFDVQAEDLENIFGTAAFKKEFLDVKYTITGISEFEVSKFINNISLHCDVDRLNRLAKINPELFQSPLFVVMLVFLSACSENIEDLNTQSKLYCSLFNCIIKNSLSRRKKCFATDFNVFDVEEKSSDCEKAILQEFGQFIKKSGGVSKLQFEVCPLTEKMYKIGFLVKHKKMSLFKTTSHFEASHKSVLEFVVAYSLWLECAMVKFELTEDILKGIVAIFNQQKSAQILPFFIGLCEGHLFQLLNYLKKYIKLYSNVEECIWELISCNKLNANLLREFCDFMPFHSYACSSNVDELKSSLVSGSVKKVCILDDEDDVVLPNVLIPQLRLIVTGGTTVANQTFSYLENVNCDNFILDFQFKTIDFHTFQMYFQSFRVINSKRNAIINLNSETLGKLPTDFQFGGIKIDHVECKLSGKDIKEFDRFGRFTTALRVDTLIKCEVLENTFTGRNTLIDIFALLPTSAEAVVVVKFGERVVFNVKDLTVQERKDWYGNVSKGVITSSSGYKRINYLNVNTPNREILGLVLKVTSVSILRCLSLHLMNVLNTLPPCWPGFPHLVELSLILCPGLSPKFWRKISKFQNLNCLELQMMGVLKPSDHVDSLLECILSLPLTNLSFHLEIVDDIEFPKCFIQKFKEICGRKTSYTLNALSIISVCGCNHTLVTDLLECLKLKLLLKVQFIVNPDVWKDTKRKIHIDYSIFNEVLKVFDVHSEDSEEIPNLPTAFVRVYDTTKTVSYIQIQLKNRN